MSRDSAAHVADVTDNANSPEVSFDEAEAGVNADEYAARLGELMDSESEDEDEGFVYDGVDAPQQDYKDQLRDALSDDGEDEDEAQEERAVEHILNVPGVLNIPNDDDELSSNHDSERALSTRVLMSPRPLLDDDQERAGSPAFSRPAFLHPNISRLRSFTPRRMASGGSSHSQIANEISPQPSHFSAISHSSSLGIPQGTSTPRDDIDGAYKPFRWTVLRELGRQIYFSQSQKVTEVLGTAGTPTVFTANGLVCVGTTKGKILVFDFKQQLRCICGSDQLGE